MMARRRPCDRQGSMVLVGILWMVLPAGGCGGSPADASLDRATIVAEIEEAVSRFHAADTARDASGVIALLWPEYSMLADGARLDYEQVVSGSQQFMASLELFHTEWTDLRVLPVGPNAAISSFIFRDSIVTVDGDLIQNQGPTTLLWVRRGSEWRVLYGDADHYPITR